MGLSSVEAVLPQSACVLAFNGQGQILLVGRRDNPGLCCLPGGKVDPGESLVEAAVRELREETGLLVRAEDLLQVFRAPCRGDQDVPWYDTALFAHPTPIREMPSSPEADVPARFGTVKELLLGSPFADYNQAALRAAVTELRALARSDPALRRALAVLSRDA